MNEHDDDLFAKDLHRLIPAKPPQDFLDRLALIPQAAQSSQDTRQAAPKSSRRWNPFLFWLTPAAVAATVVVLLVTRSSGPLPPPAGRMDVPDAKPMLKADDVEIDRQLVASFDTVAQMPDGEPVRFRLREWSDGLILRDSVRGVVIEQRTPRLEIVPVNFEVY
jgi:hypothetical protein